MRKGKNRLDKGFTLIEVIIVMSFMAIMLPTVIIGLDTMIVQSNRAEKLTVATDLARYYMEWALSKRYDELVPTLAQIPVNPATFWSVIGVDGGEVAGNPGTFDDVDDFDTLNNFVDAGFPEYTINVTVQYWDTFDEGMAAAGVWDSDVLAGGGTSDAKLITVTVSHALIDTITLDCVTGAIY